MFSTDCCDSSVATNSPACMSLLDTSTQQVSFHLECVTELVSDFVNMSQMPTRRTLMNQPETHEISEEEICFKRPQRHPSDHMFQDNEAPIDCEAEEDDEEGEYEIETRCDCEQMYRQQLSNARMDYDDLLADYNASEREVDDLKRSLAIAKEERDEYKQHYTLHEKEIENLKKELDKTIKESEKSNADFLKYKTETLEEKSNLEIKIKQLLSKPTMLNKSVEVELKITPINIQMPQSVEPQKDSLVIESPQKARYKHATAANMSIPPVDYDEHISKSLANDESKVTQDFSQSMTNISTRGLDMPINMFKSIKQEDHLVQRQKAKNNKQRNLSSNIFMFDECDRSASKTPPPKVTTQSDVDHENQHVLNIGFRKCSRRTPTKTIEELYESQTISTLTILPLTESIVSNMPAEKSSILTIEATLTGLQESRESLNQQLRKLDMIRPKTGEAVRMRNKVDKDLEVVDSQIQGLKSKIRRAALKRN